MIINYAHRGASGYFPENTMVAFQQAIQLGATGIETDVQMTSDGELVLIHDESLLRTTGINKLVKDVTLAELRQLDCGSWFSPQFARERIPTLDDLLNLAKQTSIKLNLEIKSGIVLYPDIEHKLLQKLAEYGLEQQCIISNFNHYSLAQCRALNATVATGILYMEGLYRPWDYAATVGANALHAPIYAVNIELVEQAKANNIIYNVWTVNEPQDMKKLVAAGVAGIITDYPDRLHAIICGEE
jgi:glycerophosphoryl diester phosphodiesterase